MIAGKAWIRAGRSGASVGWAGAVFGFAVAVSLWGLFERPALPGQLPGFAKAHGFAPGNDVRRLLAFLLLSVAGAVLFRVLAWRGARQRPAAPSRALAYLAAGAAALFFACAGERFAAVAGSAAIAAAAAAYLGEDLIAGARPGALALAAVSAQTVLAWTFLSGPLLVRGVPAVDSAFLLFVVAAVLARAAGRGSLERGATFLGISVLASPLAFWRSRTLSADAAAGIAALALPVLASLAWPRLEALGRRATAFALLPISVLSLSAAVVLHAPPQANLFEDGHWLTPASEYLRGEMPYRDVVPGHGLFADGLVQYLEMKAFGAGYLGYVRGERVVGALYWPLVFAAGWAATGSASFGFWGALLSFVFLPTYFFLRLLAALAVLTLVSLASRRRSRILWRAAGAALPLALLWASDFAFYAGIAALAGVLVSRGRRLKNFGNFAAGGAVSMAAVGAVFLALGVLREFVWTTFVFVPGLLPAYEMGFPSHTSLFATRLLPDVLAHVLMRETFCFWLLIFALVAAGALLARWPAVGARGRAAFPFLAFAVASSLALIERWHVTYVEFLGPLTMLVSARWLWGHRNSPALRKAAAAGIVAAMVAMARPAGNAGGFAVALAQMKTVAGAVYPDSPPRARGVGWAPLSYRTVAETGQFLKAQGFSPRDTWLDFSDTALLYFLYDRDMPVRYYEPAFYETPSAQREVIRAIEENPRVRAVLLHASDTLTDIDDISPAERAPLVWDYIQKHFHPAPSGPDVVFWLRDAGDPPGPAR